MEIHTVADALSRHAESAPERTALVGTLIPPLSYRQLWQEVSGMRRGLRQAGFGADARIVVAMPGGPHAAAALVSFVCSTVAAPLDTKLALPEVDESLRRLRPAAVALQAGSDLPARAVANRLGIPVIELDTAGDGTVNLRPAIPCIGAPASDDTGPDATAFILQTSGTTGQPKLIPYSHRNMLATAARVRDWFALTPDDRCLSVSPLHYCHGLTVTMLIPLISGGSVAFPSDAGRPDIAEWLSGLAPTWYSAGPTLHRFVLDKAQLLPAEARAHSLRFIVSGGAPLPREVSVGLQDALGVPVLEHFGASEAGQISANLPPPGPARLGTCGVPPPGTLMIAREDGSEAAPGEPGEVRVRGPTLMAGYLDAPDLNRSAFAGEWFRTGDTGILDTDGFLTLLGREKEMINRGGEKIAPPEIDEALMRHPAVLEAAAYAVQHPRLGEDVAAAVVLRPGVTVAPEELRAFLATQLAQFKIPRRIVFQQELPKGLTGKVQRRNLEGSL